MRMRLLTVVALLVLIPIFLYAVDEQWTSEGPYGGSFQAFAFHPSLENVIYAAGLDGLFRSTDTGTNWQRLDIPGGEFVVRIHPQKPERILAASSSRGVFLSSDQGTTWTLLHRYDFQDDAFYDMEFHSENPDVLYAVTHAHGVFKSNDGGTSWESKNKGLETKPVRECCIDIPQLEIDPSNSRILYTLLPSRMVFRSENGGESWNSVSSGLKLQKEVHALAMDPRNTLVLYAGGANGIFRTINGGQQWSSRGCGCYIWSFAVNPHNAREVYGVGEGAVKSSDGGKTWEWFSPHPFLSGILLGVAVHPKNPNVVFVGGFGGGIFRSMDAGRNWQTVNMRLDALNVTRLVIDPSTVGRLFAVGGQQAYESRDGGKSWDLFLKGQGSVFWISDLLLHPKNPKMIVAAGYRKTPGALTISKDGGKTWLVASPYSGVNYGCSRCIALDPSDQNVIYMAPFQKDKDITTQLGVAKSTDQGKTWHLENDGLASKDVWLLSVSPLNSNVVFAGTGAGKLYRSTNAGKSWSNAGEGLDNTSIREMAFDPSEESVLYVSTYTSIFKSTDTGLSWHRKSEGMPQGAWLNFVDVDRKTAGVVYAAGEAGIFISRDAGESWQNYDTLAGQFPFAVWNYLMDPQNPERRYMGTDRGVFVKN